MVEPYTYRRKRREFERPVIFEDSEVKPLGGYLSEPSMQKFYVRKNPSTAVLDNIPALSVHFVNTERVVTANKSMKHVEGGWPKEIEPTEEHLTTKWRTRQLKEPLLAAAVKELVGLTERAIKQNNQIDMFEEYFLGEEVDHSTEVLNTKTLMLFKDPNNVKRAISKVAWHPEGPGNKLAVAYSILRFQQMPEKMPVQSYLWDMASPNTAVKTFTPPSPLVSLGFNSKYTDLLVGGCYNGLLAVWDIREKGQPSWQSVIETSHHEPVYNVFWLHGKSGNEFVSVSTDGNMMWWDFRKEKDPVSVALLTDGENTLGGTCMEYNPEAGATKFLAGTEQGTAVLFNKKPQKTAEISHRFGFEAGKHHGAVYAIQRNPEESKCFLTVGDWTAKIWTEDIFSPIMTTKYHDTYLTDGCWSPTRPGVFFLTQMDGWMHVWDYHYRQNEIAYSHKVGDATLTCVTVQNQVNAGKYGSLVAVGDADGTVTLIELCDSLVEPTNSEKPGIKQMFEREFTREKNLRTARMKQEGKRVTRMDEGAIEKKKKEREEAIMNLEEKFFKSIGINVEEAKKEPSKPEPVPPPPPKEPSEKAPSEKAPSEKAPSEKEPSVKEPSEKEPSVKAPSEKAPSEKEPSAKEPSEKAPSEKEPSAKAPSEKAPSEKEPSVKDPNENEPEVKDPSEKEPSEKGSKKGESGGEPEERVEEAKEEENPKEENGHPPQEEPVES